MEGLVLHVEVDINPTESEEKVKKAVEKMFGNLPTQTKPSHKSNVLVSEVKSQEPLIRFRDQLRIDRIRDAARKTLLARTRGDTLQFCLNKQVAFAGHVSFSEENGESPLGPIRVTIKCDDPQHLISWLAPRKVDR